MSLPVLYLCKGPACKRAKGARRRLINKVDGHARVVAVGCQDLCSAPVAGCQVDGQLEWFRRLDSKKSRRALVALLKGARIKSSLAKRRAKKRSGRAPK